MEQISIAVNRPPGRGLTTVTADTGTGLVQRCAMSQTLVDQLREGMDTFSPTERQVAHRLLADFPVAGLQSATELARQVGVSTPTVLRMATRLGYGSYADLQRRLRSELGERLSSPLNKLSPPDNRRRAASGHSPGAFAGAVIHNIEQTFAHLAPQEFRQFVRLLGDPKLRVHLVGGRFTDALARYLAVQLRVIRPAVRHLQDQEANWQDQLLDFDRRDLLLLFDIRRYQPSLARIAEAAASRKARVLLITDQWLSPIARVARHVLTARVQVPSIWDSNVALMAISEALLAAITRSGWQASQARMQELERLRNSADDAGRRPGARPRSFGRGSGPGR